MLNNFVDSKKKRKNSLPSRTSWNTLPIVTSEMTGIVTSWTLTWILITIITTIIDSIATCCTRDTFVRIWTTDLIRSTRSISYRFFWKWIQFQWKFRLTTEISIFITHITTIVIQIAFIRRRNTSTIGTSKLMMSTSTIATIQFITTIWTLSKTIAKESLK